MRQAREINSPEVFSWGGDARDRAACRPGAVHGQGDFEPGFERRAFLARFEEGLSDSRTGGGGAVCEPEKQARTSAPRGAGLAGWCIGS